MSAQANSEALAFQQSVATAFSVTRRTTPCVRENRNSKETSVSQHGEASYYCLLGYETVQSGRCVQDIRRYIPLRSSEYSVEVASVSDSFVKLLNAAATQNTSKR